MFEPGRLLCPNPYLSRVVTSPGGSMSRKREGEGQSALVTGASMGIGVDLAECFAKDGYDVILAARSETALKSVAERLAREHGVKTTPIAIDLGLPGGGEKLAAAIA